MTTDPQRRLVRVAATCTREQVQEIRVRVGDSLAIGNRTQQHPASVWNATEDGHHGWVPQATSRSCRGRNAVARHNYDSAHLTVVAGETSAVLKQVGDYLLCRNAAGVEGWVPESCAEETVGGP